MSGSDEYDNDPFAPPRGSGLPRKEVHMKLTATAALFGPLVLAVPAQAEFQVAPIRLEAGAVAQAGPQPVTPYPGTTLPTAAAVRRHRTGVTPVVPVALGFGRQVPLAFATRQIVPAGVKLTFGPEVEQDALVDWSGGRPWVEALRTAVRPLGLRVSVNWKSVSITRT